MAKNDLDDFGGVSWENSKRVVPKTAGNNKTRIDSDNKTIGAHFDFLAEIVP